MSSLASCSRRELQLLAKQHGLKANQKSEDLIDQLRVLKPISAVPPSTKARLSPGVSHPGSGSKLRSPASSATQRSPAKGALQTSAIPLAAQALERNEQPVEDEAEAEAEVAKPKSLLQSPGWARRRSSVGAALRADANQPAEENEEPVIDPRRVELIRQKVQARKDASKAHRTTRAEDRLGRLDKVRAPRPTQPRILHRCPGVHLSTVAAGPSSAAAPPAATAAVSTPRASSTSVERSSALRPAVPVLLRSPFVAQRSVKALTEPVDFSFAVGASSRQATLSVQSQRLQRPKALHIAERKRRLEEERAIEKARRKDEVRRKVAEHHLEFADAKKPLAPLSQNAPAEPPSAKTAPPRAGIKQVATSTALRQRKIERFALDSKTRKNARLMAARQF